MPADALRKVQVNIPFRMLEGHLLDLVLKFKINPEIGLDAQVLDSLGQADFAAVAGRLQRAGLTVTLHAPFEDLSPGSHDPDVYRLTRRRFEQVVALLPVFRPRHVVCHAGYDDRRYWYHRSQWQANSLKLWSWLGAAAAAAGGRLMLENVYESDPRDIGELLDRLDPDHIGFCLDIGHAHVFGAVPLPVWLDTLTSRLDHLHLHDNDGRRDDHLPLGRGQINLTPVVEYLNKRRNDCPVLTLEPHTEKDLWPSLEYLARHFPV